MTASFAVPRAVRQPRCPLRLGFVGVGWIGRHRMDALLRSGIAHAAAIVEPNPEAARAARATAPGAELVSSLDELLALGVDGVVIATPSAQHAEQAIRALTEGAAVFCQKPLGRNATECRSVVEAARHADRLLGVDLSYRHVNAVRTVVELVRSGTLGRVFACDLVFHNAYGPDKSWFYDPALAGGGCLVDLGIHLADLALWAFGDARVRRVTAQLFAKGTPVREGTGEVEDYAVAHIELDSGTIVRLACSWHASAGRDAVIEAAFYGTDAGAAIRNVSGSFYDFTAEQYRGTAAEVLVAPPDDWGGRAAVAWARRVADGARFDDDAGSLIAVAELLDAIYTAGGRR